jgi:peroxin-2
VRLFDWCTRVETVFVVASLANKIAFLRNGGYRSVSERLVGLQLTYASRPGPRYLNFDFMNRQLVWKSLTDFLLFAAPFIPWSLVGHATGHIGRVVAYVRALLIRGVVKLRGALVPLAARFGLTTSWLEPYLPFLRGQSNGPKGIKGIGDEAESEAGAAAATAGRLAHALCPICNQAPQMPHRAGCEHVFCYYCLESARLDSPSFACPRCGIRARSATRVTVP